MKVTTEIKRLDLVRLNLSVMPKLKSTYVTLIILCFFIFLFLIFSNGIPDTTKNWFALLLGAVIGSVGGLALGTCLSMIGVLFMSSKESGVLGIHEYQISTEGLHEKTRANEGLTHWKGIKAIISTKSYLMFQINGYLFHFMPKRDFDSIEQFKQFTNRATEYWNAARQDS